MEASGSDCFVMLPPPPTARSARAPDACNLSSRRQSLLKRNSWHLSWGRCCARCSGLIWGGCAQEYVKVVRRLLAKCHAYDEVLSAKWLPRLCAYSSSSRYLAAAMEDLIATPALTPVDAAEAAVAAAAITAVNAATEAAAAGGAAAATAAAGPRVLRGALHAGSTALHAGHSAVTSLGGFVAAATAAAAPGVLRGALHAGHSAVASLSGFVPAHLPALLGAVSGAAADAAAPAAADAAPPVAELLVAELREVNAVADACSTEAARAVAESAVAELSGARAALRGGGSAADVATALAPAVEALQGGLPRLAAGLDRSGFQTAMRRAGAVIDEVVSSELREAAAVAGTDDVKGMMAAICEVCPCNPCHS